MTQPKLLLIDSEEDKYLRAVSGSFGARSLRGPSG